MLGSKNQCRGNTMFMNYVPNIVALRLSPVIVFAVMCYDKREWDG